MKTLKLNLNKVIAAASFFILSNNTFSQSTIWSVSSGDWSNPAIWDCGCVPGINDDVFVNPNNSVEITSDAYVHHLGIEPNGELVMNQPVKLNITGDFDIIGNLNFTDGTVELNGTTAQYVDAGGNTVHFNNITINNSSINEVTFYMSEYFIHGTVDPVYGNLVIENDPNNHFILYSTETQKARIGQLSSYSSITGPVEVVYYLPAGTSGFRNLASPVIGADFSMWDESLMIYGSAMPDGCASWDTTCQASVKSYVSDNYQEIATINEPITNGKGYELDLADDSLNFNGAIIKSIGTLNTYENIVVNVGAGWNLVGNVYASDIDFNNVTKTGVSDYFYVYSTETGGFEWWDGLSQTGSSLGIVNNGRISMGQGFYVEGPGSITFSQASKTTVNTEFIKTNQKIDEAIYLTLSEEVSGYSCQISLQGNDAASIGFDQGLDILNLSTGIEKCPIMVMEVDEKAIRKNYIAENGIEQSFDLGTNFKHDGYYSISAQNIPNFNLYDEVILVDLLTNEEINLIDITSYEFYAQVNENNRFRLILRNKSNGGVNEVIELDNSVCTAVVINGELILTSETYDGNVTIEVYALNGQVIDRSEGISMSAGNVTVSGLKFNTGMNLIAIKMENQIQYKKLMIQ